MRGPPRDGRPRDALVFDLDGTLIDSLPDIVESFRAAFHACGMEAPDDAAVRRLIGKPLEEMYGLFTDDPGRVAALTRAYRRIYPRRFTQATRPFPGVVPMLGELRGRGWRLAVATTKRSEMATRLVEALGLDDHLDHVQGTDDFPHKPAPDVVWRALAALGSEGSWMIGDTVSDLQAGRAAGLRTFGVTWGTHSRGRLAEADPDVLEDDLTRLPDWVGHPPAD